MKKKSIYNQASQIWKDIAKEINEEELKFELEIHKKLLSVFQVGDYYYYIFNIKKFEFEFVSDEMIEILGYKAEEITVPNIINAIHPEDQAWFLNFENKVGEFYKTLSIQQIPNYKVSYDYRLKKKNGEYIRVLQQVIAISFNEEGNLLRSIGIHTDISHIKPFGKPNLSFIGLNGEPSFYNVEVEEIFHISNMQLSKREREILCLILNGHNSNEIAEILYISKLTVDTHRKNILTKSGSKNATELSNKAIQNGWI